MPTILDTIRDYDEDILTMIAETWGIEIDFKGKASPAEQLAAFIRQGEITAEVISALRENSKKGLKTLIKEDGKIQWDQFTRKYGELREMGAGRRERERPDRNPVSATEVLFYKALIGRAFLENSQGLFEFAFLPDEIHQFLKPTHTPVSLSTINQVPERQVEKKLISNDKIIDTATTILAGLRTGLSAQELISFTTTLPYSFLNSLLTELKLVSGNQVSNTEKVKIFLESERGPALTLLAGVWKNSQEMNDLDLIETLIFEGKTSGNLKFSRNALINHIQNLSDDAWYSFDDICSWIHQNEPDILRSGGDYEAWFIKNSTTGEYVRDFKYWPQVEGAYIRMMLQKPLFWLGFLDLGKLPGESQPSVFRKSKWFNALAADGELNYPCLKKKEFEIEKSGRIRIDRFFPRNIRYQIARCCDWESIHGQNYSYHLSPRAFKRMEQQGLKVSQLTTLINHYARKPVPRNILLALERWESNGQETEINKILVIKVKTAPIMDRLMASNVKKFILGRLNPLTAEITADAAPIIKAALIEMGIFAEISPDV